MAYSGRLALLIHWSQQSRAHLPNEGGAQRSFASPGFGAVAVGKFDNGHGSEIVDAFDPPIDASIDPNAMVEAELVANAAKGFAADGKWIMVWPLDIGAEMRSERSSDNDGGFATFLRTTRGERPSHIDRKAVVRWTRFGNNPAFTPDVFNDKLPGSRAAFRLWAWHDSISE
jgi:hypothetical protein